MTRSRGIALVSCVVACVALSSHARATVVQVDGTIVPRIPAAPHTTCNDDMQACLDIAEGTPGSLDAILDASQLPEIFRPNTAMPVTFRDVGEGAGFENSFGYYNVGDDPTITANLHPILGCGVTAATHASEANGYVQSAEPGTVTTVNFATEQMAGRYRGGFIAFYLIAPEGNPSGDNCGDFVNGTDGMSLFGRAYFTERAFNNDGDFVHHLVYQSRLATDRFYFGFEDLFRGGDNDYEDMLVQVTGLTPPCTPAAEICDGRDNDCDGLVDGADPSLSGVGAACTCDGSMGLTCEGGNRQGVCRTGATACVGGAVVCRSSVTPTAELCNGLDDNCNGTTDDSPSDVGGACDGTDGDLCNEGVFVCSMGTRTCGDLTGTNGELCNGADDDCDTRTDESPTDVGGACDGADSDLCQEGTFTCSMGSRVCSDATGSSGELCNGADDDCDTRTDESPTDVGTACSAGVGTCRRVGALVCTMGAPMCNAVAGAPGTEACNGADDDCDSRIDETFGLGAACMAPGICGTGVVECATSSTTRCSSGPGGSMSGARTETCNSLDDDCDGRTDEGLADLGACGTETGECVGGRLRCVAGAPACVGGVGPLPETCDSLDNDCDSRSDEAASLIDDGGSCGTDVGECEPGTEVCTMGMLRCTGAVGPGTETCNALDDDCDAITDESPTDVGATCGTTDVGECDLGMTICVAGGLVCNGATEPSVEVCNGRDDDCDGTIDEDPVDVGRTCGSAMGTCTPGRTTCMGGMVVCDGATVGTTEICNGIDDDCDTVIDDMPSDEGAACGSMVGVCEEGTERCIAGALQCVGGVTPGTEVCNGFDDDCDGVIDDGELCAPGVCRGNLGCASMCIETEFGPMCPRGQTCDEGYCVDDACFGVTCMPTPEGARTICQEGDCVPFCDTVMCDAPSVCRPSDGACVANTCVFLPELCSDTQICVEGTCVDDPCAGVSCDAREFCRMGTCVTSCAGVECSGTEVCRDGECAPTGCAEECTGGEVCRGGECQADVCRTMSCDGGEVCDPSTGMCIDDPCRNIECPSAMEVCSLGECISRPMGMDAGPTGGRDAGVDAGESGRRDVLAAGGGGVLCSIGGGAGAGGSRGGWGGIATFGIAIALLALGRRRRRSREPSVATRGVVATLALVAITGVLTSGCDVDPYCLDECDGGVSAGEDARVGADGGDAQVPQDAEAGVDSCVPDALEECNEADDDCDGRIDEGIDLQNSPSHCGRCNNPCELDGAQTECSEGMCQFVMCFDGNYDIDMDTDEPYDVTNGCEYECFRSNDGVEACDTLDNDCDSRVDETFDLTSDEQNCGRCGQVCRFFRVMTATCTDGMCGFDPATDCEPGYIDTNGIAFDGCEFECTPTGAETCNGLDDDCDTRTDEGFDLDTSVLNCGRCGRVCTFPNATPRCTTGTCGFDPMTDCNPGFSDRDGVQLNGCEYPCTPTADPTEICDGVDNDCDGRVDGATTDAGGTCSNGPGGVARGICTATGTTSCVGARLICVGAPEPQTERCNGMDDDCDGTLDDAPVDVGRLCATPVGACSAGFSICTGGVLGCDQAVTPSPELCNGVDDDCDGTTDESPTDPTLGTTCGTSAGICTTGTIACVSGALTCMGGTSGTLEICNSVDDDCDGAIDDDVVDDGGPCGSSVGVCRPGSEICMGGMLVCSGGIGAGTETCDNRDQDCDGSTDESITQACYTGPMGTSGRGICRGGTQTCVAGTFSACAGQVLPATETCNGTNDDCDLATDEGVTRACYTGPMGTEGRGLCRAGTQACTGGVFGGACTGQVLPATEICDGADQDCDGRTDETAAGTGAPLTQSCYTGAMGTAGVGTCRSGTQTCAFGAFGVCTGETTPAREWCGDALDTDCDALGDAAEGCLSVGTETRLDGPLMGSGSGDQSALGAFHSYDVVLASGGSPVGRNVYAAWVDKRYGTDTADIFFARSTDGGATWGTIVNLTSGIGDRAVAPRLAVGRSGSDDVVHVSFQTVNGGIRHVRVVSSTNSGAAFGTVAQLDTSGSTDNFKQAIACSTDGARVIVAWEQLSTSTLARQVVSAASTNSGSSWGGERRVSVNAVTRPTAGRPVVAVTSTGRFVFVWREIRSPRLTFDVFATYADDRTGAIATGREVRLDSDPMDNRAADELRIANTGTQVYVAWQEIRTDVANDSDIAFARGTDPTGGGANTWTSPVILDDPTGEVSTSYDATIAVDPNVAGTTTDDRVWVAWVDTRDGSQIGLRRSLDSGSTFQAYVRATSSGGNPMPGVCSQPRMAFVGGNTIVIAYTNDPSGGNRRIRAASSPDLGVSFNLTDPLVDGGTGDADLPAITRFDSASAPTVGAVIAWSDFRTSPFINADIYRARVGR